jgi:hypothetical protein
MGKIYDVPLSDLLAGVTQDNIHPATDGFVIDDSIPVTKEEDEYFSTVDPIIIHSDKPNEFSKY